MCEAARGDPTTNVRYLSRDTHRRMSAKFCCRQLHHLGLDPELCKRQTAVWISSGVNLAFYESALGLTSRPWMSRRWNSIQVAVRWREKYAIARAASLASDECKHIQHRRNITDVSRDAHKLVNIGMCVRKGLKAFTHVP